MCFVKWHMLICHHFLPAQATTIIRRLSQTDPLVGSPVLMNISTLLSFRSPLLTFFFVAFFCRFDSFVRSSSSSHFSYINSFATRTLFHRFRVSSPLVAPIRAPITFQVPSVRNRCFSASLLRTIIEQSRSWSCAAVDVLGLALFAFSSIEMMFKLIPLTSPSTPKRKCRIPRIRTLFNTNQVCRYSCSNSFSCALTRCMHFVVRFESYQCFSLFIVFHNRHSAWFDVCSVWQSNDEIVSRLSGLRSSNYKNKALIVVSSAESSSK